MKAEDWSMGDALANQAELNAASDPSSETRLEYQETGRQSYDDDKKAAEAVARGLRKQAERARNGAVVTVKNTGNRRKADWTVIVEVPVKKKK